MGQKMALKPMPLDGFGSAVLVLNLLEKSSSKVPVHPFFSAAAFLIKQL